MSTPANATKAWAFDLIATRARNAGYSSATADDARAVWKACQNGTPWLSRDRTEQFIRDQFRQFESTIKALPDE